MLERMVEVYRQLKLAMQKQENKIQALAFQSYEYEYYRRLMKITRNESSNKWEDRFILLAGRTNDFGQSWERALVLMALFIFPINFLIIGIVTLKFPNSNHCAFCETFAY